MNTLDTFTVSLVTYYFIQRVRILVLLICLILLMSSVQAGVSGIERQKILGGSDDDEGYSIQPTSDGDVTDYHGFGDIWFVNSLKPETFKGRKF